MVRIARWSHAKYISSVIDALPYSSLGFGMHRPVARVVGSKHVPLSLQLVQISKTD